MTEPNKGDKRKRPAMDESEGSKKSVSVTPKRKRLSEDYGPGQGGAGGASGSGTPVTRKTVPLSERQQMALLKEMAAQERPDAGGLSPQQGGSSTPGSAQTPRSSLDRKINKRNERGETPLHLAAIRGDLKQVKQLMKAQAEVNVQDFAGWTPLHEACNHGFLDVAKCLLKGGALVNAQGADNDTPLHDAAINGNPDLVKLLLRFGADAHQTNSAGRTPLDVAANTEITKLLLMRKKELFSGSSSDSEYDVGSRSPQPSSPDSMQPDEELELSADTSAGGGGSGLGVSVVQRTHETKAAAAGESSAAREQSPTRWSSWTGLGGEPKRARMTLNFPVGGSAQQPHGSTSQLTLQTGDGPGGSASDFGSSAVTGAAGAVATSQGQGAASAYDVPAGSLTATRLMAASSSSPIELLASLPLTSGNITGGFTAIAVGGSHCQQQPPPSALTQPMPPHVPAQQHQPMAVAASLGESSVAKQSDGCDMEVEAIAQRSPSDDPAAAVVPNSAVAAHSDVGLRTAALGVAGAGGGASSSSSSSSSSAGSVTVGSGCGRVAVQVDGGSHQQQPPSSALPAASAAAATVASGVPVGAGASSVQQRASGVASTASTSEGERQSPVPERVGGSGSAAASGRLLTSVSEGKSHHLHHHPAGGVSSGLSGSNVSASGGSTERRGSMHSQHRNTLGEERSGGRERRDREARAAAGVTAKDAATASSVAGAVTASLADTTSMSAKRELQMPKEVPVTAPADSSSQAVTGQPALSTAGSAVAAGSSGPEGGGSRLPEKEQQTGVTRSSRARERLMKSGASISGSSTTGAAGTAGNGSGSCTGSSSSSSSSSASATSCSSGNGAVDADGGAELRELRRGEQRRGSGPRDRDAGSPGGDRNKPSSPKVPPLKIILPSKSPTAKDLPYVVSGTEPQADGVAGVATAGAQAAAVSSSCSAGEGTCVGAAAGADIGGAATVLATTLPVQASSLATASAAVSSSTATAATATASASGGGSSSNSIGPAAACSSAVPAVLGAAHKEDEPSGGPAAAEVEEKETVSRRTLRSHTHSMQQRLQQQQQQLQQMGSHQQASLPQQGGTQPLQQQHQHQQQQQQATTTTQQPSQSQQVPQPGQSHTMTAPTGALGTSSVSVTVSGQSGSSEEHINIHPRKRKLRPRPEPTLIPQVDLLSSTCMHTNNPYQLSAELRKEVWKKRESMFSVAPKPPSQFQDYLMSNRKYLLAGNDRAQAHGAGLAQPPPPSLTAEPLRDLFIKQEDDRRRLRLHHQVEREKLSLAIEQETLRVHGRAARAVANQEVPLGFCSILRDTEIYNVYHPFHVKINVNKEEDRDRNTNRSHYNNRQFLSWLQDVDDKFEKLKESMLTRQRHEAASLHAVQRMDWEWKLKELGFCDYQSQPVIDAVHVPIVAVSDDVELLPA